MNWLKTVVLVAAFLGLTSAVPAQEHNHDGRVIISGSEHPELISDTVAYRLFFVVLTQESQPGQPSKSELQRSRFQAVGLSDIEISAVYVILDDFRTKYNALVKEYNDAKETKGGSSAKYPEFKAKLEALVQQTRDQLAVYLGETSMKKFNLHVQGEKRFMNQGK